MAANKNETQETTTDQHDSHCACWQCQEDHARIPRLAGAIAPPARKPGAEHLDAVLWELHRAYLASKRVQS